jgi:hypothetical protein
MITWGVMDGAFKKVLAVSDRAAECFSLLKSESGMTIVHFDNVQLRCGIGPDINWGHIVVGHVY